MHEELAGHNPARDKHNDAELWSLMKSDKEEKLIAGFRAETDAGPGSKGWGKYGECNCPYHRAYRALNK
jgi:hypothetical protein